jgi:phosphoribosylanthranilate isomerase
VWIKICGVTNPDDAELAIALGVDAIGINLVPSSPRVVDPHTARSLTAHVRGRVEVVGVMADLPVARARELRAEIGLSTLQLHGSESPEMLAELLPQAYKAVRLGDDADVEAAASFGGDRLLVDAKVAGQLGGTGIRVEARLVRALAEGRRVILAGGLDVGCVEQAIIETRPFGVDVASGVETLGQPRRKDPDKVAEFVRAARHAI